jgi:oxygen-independent coproporphyrinogen-3 oxidase
MSRIDIPQALLERFDVPAPRYTSYPPIPYWPNVDAAQWERWVARPQANGSSLSLYVHIPFCRARCTYCACFVIVTGRQDVAERYAQTVCRELELVGSRVGSGAPARQFHLGGGTPTFLSRASIAALLESARRQFAFDRNAELSIEVDPRTIGEEGLGWLRELGFNRLSLGIQDFDETVQRAVNRVQPFAQVRALMAEARSQAFLSVNFDLIYGLPHQSRATFERTLEQVLELAPDRLALYNYAHLPEAMPHQHKIDPAALPDRDEKLEIFQTARERLMGAGYAAIGLDHFARPEDDLARAHRDGSLQRNFMGYTTQAGSGLLAFGVSAISDWNGVFWQNEKKLSRYTRAVEAGTAPVVKGLALTEDDRLRRAIIGSLFCGGKVNFAELGVSFHLDVRSALREELAALESLQALGLVKLDQDRIEVTDRGQYFLRNIALVFDAYHGHVPQAAPRFSRTV